MVEWVVLLLFPVGVMDRVGIGDSARLGGIVVSLTEVAEPPPVKVAKSMIGMEDEVGSVSFEGVERYCCSGVGVGG